MFTAAILAAMLAQAPSKPIETAHLSLTTSASAASVAPRGKVTLAVDVTPVRSRPEIEANAYFLIAEALTNVAKHSNAREATVRVWVADDQLHVEVGDDGVGGARRDGGGLGGLADRIEALGGRLEVDSPLAGGTRITATLPR